MAGQGKYTTYIPANDPKVVFLKKLYANSPFSEGGPFAGETNDVVAKAVAEAGNAFLLAVGAADRKQEGDGGHFPKGVSMDYSYKVEDESVAPDISAVAWVKRGDPATGYFPDLVSAVDAVPRDADPGIAVEDIKPTYVPGADGTVNPVVTNDAIDAANQLLAPIVKGQSKL